MKRSFLLLALLAVSMPMALAQKQPKPKPKPKPPKTAPKKEADITISCNIKDGQTISGTIKFELLISTEGNINKVDYTLNQDIIGSDESTPYEFTLDTIREKEGPVTVKFLVQTDEGKRKTLILNLKIDNGLSKGLDHWIQAGNDALTSAKWADAILAGRLALKIKEDSDDAKMMLARAYFGQGILDEAQRFIENVLNKSPENVQALDLQSAISLRRAFTAGGVSKNRIEALTGIQDALKSAASSRIKTYEVALNQLGSPTDENRLAVADAALRAGRYSVAIDALRSAYEKDASNTSVTNRLLYALLRLQRIQEANTIAANYIRRGQPDGEGYAILAIIAERMGDAANAKEYERQAILNEANGLGVRTAQAYLALWRNNDSQGQKIVDGLLRDEDARAETNFYASQMLYRAGEFDRSRERFEKAVLAEPARYDLFIQQGAQAMDLAIDPASDAKAKEYYRAVAKTYFNAALAAKPESFSAFTGMALVLIAENKPGAAADQARLANKTGPEYAAGYYVLALALLNEEPRLIELITSTKVKAAQAKGNGLREEAEKLDKEVATLEARLKENQRERGIAVDTFRVLDKPNLQGQPIPDPRLAVKYFSRFGRLPVLILHAAQ